MAQRLALIGGGGHALSLLDILPLPASATGYVDIHQNYDMPIPYLGNDNQFIATHHPEEYDIIVTLVSGPDGRLATRAKVLDTYRRYNSPVVISPKAVVSPSAIIGDGTAIFHLAAINASASIGKHSIINTGAIVEHGCRLGNNIFIGPGAVICGGVTIGDNSYIGAGAIVRPGISISRDSIIGMGATVTKDIAVSGTYIGTPAIRIK